MPLDGIVVQKCSNADIQPHLLRYGTIYLLQHLIDNHSVNFDECREHLLAKTKEFEEYNLDDDMSKGIIKNLNEQVNEAMKK